MTKQASLDLTPNSNTFLELVRCFILHALDLCELVDVDLALLSFRSSGRSTFFSLVVSWL